MEYNSVPIARTPMVKPALWLLQVPGLPNLLSYMPTSRGYLQVRCVPGLQAEDI